MFFLKYRPQTIEDLDLKDVREQLKRILAQKKIPQAFLFAGPRGAGKTSAARILAKAINCLQPQGIEPCNQCSLCQEITAGSSLDILEIDAASNRGIDDIRQLRERVGLAPARAKYKVYIIDEVHMLTKEAFNALLKTLEEPPAHVVFILCTTDPEKIIPTILSRLLRIDFRRGRPEEVKRSLEKVIRGEKLMVAEEVIEAIIGLADGGFRDAQKILESLVLRLGKKINWPEAQPLLGHWENRQPEVFLKLLAQKKLKLALAVIEELVQEGGDLVDYLRRLLDCLRQLILVHHQVGVEVGTELKQLANQFSLTQLVRLSRLLSQAALEGKKALLPQLPFQLAIVEFIEERSQVVSSLPPSPPSEEKKSRAAKSGAKIDSQSPAKIELKELIQRWDDLLAAVKPMNHSVAAFLRAARPKAVQGETLILEVFYRFHKDKLEEERNRRIVESGLNQVCGCSLKIRCVLGQRPTNSATSKRQADRTANKQEQDNQPVNSEDELYRLAREIFGS